MLLTIEKVLVLKSVGIFAEIPEEYLVEVARTLSEVRAKANEEIFGEGDIGTSLFIILGNVLLHCFKAFTRILHAGLVYTPSPFPFAALLITSYPSSSPGRSHHPKPFPWGSVYVLVFRV